MVLDLNQWFAPNPADKGSLPLLQPTTPKTAVPTSPAILQPWKTIETLPPALVQTADTLLKTQNNTISSWQQLDTNLLQQGNSTYKFATPEADVKEPVNNWLESPNPPENKNKTSTQKLLSLYKASAPKPTQGDGKLVVGGQGNFGSIEKGGTGGLFSSSTSGE
jgi:hypothetical protein